jgi:hypothetical protein
VRAWYVFNDRHPATGESHIRLIEIPELEDPGVAAEMYPHTIYFYAELVTND